MPVRKALIEVGRGRVQVGGLRLDMPEGVSMGGPNPCACAPSAPPSSQVTSMASSSCGGRPYAGGCATSFPAGMVLTGAFNRSV